MPKRRVHCIDGGTFHAWGATGLDIVAEVLSSTRRCAWCGEQQAKPYPGGPKQAWRKVRS